MPLLTDDELTIGLATVPTWTAPERVITAEYHFRDFAGAMAFVSAVAKLDEAANHHPDIDIRWNRVVLRLTTHDHGGVTEKDVELAHQIQEALARSS